MKDIYGYVVDPKRNTLQKVIFDNDADDCHTALALAIKSEYFEVVYLTDDLLVMVDDEGARTKSQYGISYEGGIPFFGPGLFLGYDQDSGELQDIPITAEELASRVQVLSNPSPNAVYREI